VKHHQDHLDNEILKGTFTADLVQTLGHYIVFCKNAVRKI